MADSENEMIAINGKVLQLGILNDGANYQVYSFPGMTVAEMAFDVMVLIRLLEDGEYIKNKDEFIALIEKYYNDPQYAPLKEAEKNEQN